MWALDPAGRAKKCRELTISMSERESTKKILWGMLEIMFSLKKIVFSPKALDILFLTYFTKYIIYFSVILL